MFGSAFFSYVEGKIKNANITISLVIYNKILDWQWVCLQTDKVHISINTFNNQVIIYDVAITNYYSGVCKYFLRKMILKSIYV